MNHYYEVLGPWGEWSLDQPEMGWKAYLVTEAMWESSCNKSSHVSGYLLGDRPTSSLMSMAFSLSYTLCFTFSKPHWVFLPGCNEHFSLKIFDHCPSHRVADKYHKFKTRNDKSCASRDEKDVRVKWLWVHNTFGFVNVQNSATLSGLWMGL